MNYTKLHILLLTGLTITSTCTMHAANENEFPQFLAGGAEGSESPRTSTVQYLLALNECLSDDDAYQGNPQSLLLLIESAQANLKNAHGLARTQCEEEGRAKEAQRRREKEEQRTQLEAQIKQLQNLEAAEAAKLKAAKDNFKNKRAETAKALQKARAQLGSATPVKPKLAPYKPEVPALSDSEKALTASKRAARNLHNAHSVGQQQRALTNGRK
ncbi:MAG TPA: hypothetical protein VGT41_00635 [Candidatus Babeliales bacterium]|nr:hypothetical protein [Candidatus Babeliales bacterium]